MKNLVTVIETNMWDGNDLIHEWYSVEEALESGRFDFLIEDGSYTEKYLTSRKSVEFLVELVGYPFSVWEEYTEVVSERDDRVNQLTFEIEELTQEINQSQEVLDKFREVMKQFALK